MLGVATQEFLNTAKILKADPPPLIQNRQGIRQSFDDVFDSSMFG